MSTKINIETLETLRPKPEKNRALVILKSGSVSTEEAGLDSNTAILRFISDIDLMLSGVSNYELQHIEYLLNAGVQVVVVQPTALIDEIKGLIDNNLDKYDFSVITAPGYFIEEETPVSTDPEETPVSTESTDPDLIALASLVSNSTVELHINVSSTLELGSIDANRNVSLFTGEGILNRTSKYKDEDNDILIQAAVAAQARKLLFRINGTPYLPIAGETHGVFREFKDVKPRLGRKQKEDYQKAYINPFFLKRGVGVHLVAQNTRNDITSNGHLKPLNRAHANTLTNYLADYFRELGDDYHFRPNNQSTWNHFKLDANKILSRLAKEDGIEDYAVRVGRGITMSEEDIAAGDFKAEIHFLPIRVIEAVTLSLIVHDTGETIVDLIIDKEEVAA